MRPGLVLALAFLITFYASSTMAQEGIGGQGVQPSNDRLTSSVRGYWGSIRSQRPVVPLPAPTVKVYELKVDGRYGASRSPSSSCKNIIQMTRFLKGKGAPLEVLSCRTFMPKPIFGDNGSGMHCHISLWKDGQPLFAGDKYAGLSQTALWFIGGILKHAPAMCAITNPTTNSYKRLVPGFEAPIRLAYSYRNRSAAIRIPNTGTNPKAKRIEFRTPDPSSNIYMCLATLLMAGIDGIQNKINPGDPLDKDIYGLTPQELKGVPSVPATLEHALDNLREGSAFLKKGDVFSEDLVETWIDYKYTREVIPLQQRPSPYEFYLYYDL